MRPLYLLLILLCSFSTASAQFSVFEYNFNTVVNGPCPQDSTQQIGQPDGWEVYQTSNNNWDGPRLPNCFPAIKHPSLGVGIALGGVDINRPLFVRARPMLFANQMPLEPNSLYLVEAFGNTSEGVDLTVGSNCFQDLCTGIFTGISVPGALRIHTAQPEFILNNFVRYQSCFPSEYFASQFLSELVFKFVFKPGATLSNKYVYLNYMKVSKSYVEPALIDTVPALPAYLNTTTGIYNVPANAVATPSWGEGYILHYKAPTFPAAATPSYVEAQPVPNTATPKTINLIIYPYEVIEIQPFTYLRGGLTAGSDTLRHIANLVNNGGDFCLNFVDLVFSGGGGYHHRAGTITMNNAFSCMQFKNGSEMRVLENGSLHYGNNGIGMLALCATSTVVLERNASLVIDAVVNMSECNDALPPQQLYMDLPPGSQLIFTSKAHLTNQFSRDQKMRLNVRMLGGRLDDSALPEADRALINRIYPEVSKNLSENINILNNPASSSLRLQYLAAGEEKVSLSWLNAAGVPVREEQLTVVKGWNEVEVDCPPTAGLYFLVFENGGRAVKRVVVSE